MCRAIELERQAAGDAGASNSVQIIRKKKERFPSDGCRKLARMADKGRLACGSHINTISGGTRMHKSADGKPEASCQPPRYVLGEVRQNHVGPGPSNGKERLHDNSLSVNPARAGCRFDH